MRPITLKMQAFGSYAEETEIAFTKATQNLLLITGDTGAGKSTIYDAITFALYQEASSMAHTKEGLALQSQYATYDVEPYVEYTFAASAKENAPVYTIRRVPKHRRLKKKRDKTGKNYTEKNGSVVLTMPDGTVYAEKNVEEKIVEIVGLTKGQFMQIAMIAQGEFMELLQAKTKDKKLIFRKLFGTEVYEQVVRELERRLKSKGKDLAVLKTACINEISHVRYIQTMPPSEAQTTLQQWQDVLMEGDMSVLQDYLEGLEAYCQELKGIWQGADAAYTLAQEEQKQAQDAYSKAETLVKIFEQEEQAGRRLAVYQQQEEEMQDRERQISGLEAYLELLPLMRLYETSRDAYAKLQLQQEQETRQLPLFRQNLEEAEKTLAAAKPLYEETKTRLGRLERTAEQDLAAFRELEVLSVRLSQEEQAGEALQTRMQDYQQWQQQQEEKQQKLTEQLSSNETADWQWERLSQEQQRLDTLAQQYEALGRLHEELLCTDASYQEALEELKQTNQQYQECSRRYEWMHQCILDNQLGHLAQSLVEGEPCMVCGSREHPMPFRYVCEQELPSQAALEQAKQERDVLDERRREQELRVVSLKTDGERVERELKTGIFDFCEALDIRTCKAMVPQELDVRSYPRYQEALKAVLTAAVETCRTNKQELQQKQEKHAQAKRELEQLSTEREAKQRDMETCSNCLQENADKRLQISTEMETRQKLLTWQTADAVTAVQQQVRQQLSENEAGYQAHVDKTNAARLQLSRTQTRIEQYAAQLPDACCRMEETKQDYEKKIDKFCRQGICVTDEDWLQSQKAYTEKDLHKWKAQLQQYKEDVQAARQQLQTAREWIGTQERPDLQQLSETLAEREVRLREANQMQNTYAAAYEVNRSVLRAVKKQYREREGMAQAYAVLEKLYRRAAGTQAEETKMDVETFVQRYYLQQILQHANIRLEQMTNGAYELRRKDVADAGKRHNEGLDLMVYSHINGALREVHTLSGGESFMAALSLALGLADQIQLQSAAVHMDMMFIDEGFGSLDTQARTAAIKTLKAMAGSSRLISIISHVDALKQEIEDQLIVTKDQQGSHVHWRNG